MSILNVNPLSNINFNCDYTDRYVTNHQSLTHLLAIFSRPTPCNQSSPAPETMGFFIIIIGLVCCVVVNSQCAITSSFTIVAESRPEIDGCYDYNGYLNYFPNYVGENSQSLFADASVTSYVSGGYLYYIGYYDASGDSVVCFSAVTFWTSYDYVEELNDDGWRECTDGGIAGEITISCGCDTSVEEDPVEDVPPPTPTTPAPSSAPIQAPTQAPLSLTQAPLSASEATPVPTPSVEGGGGSGGSAGGEEGDGESTPAPTSSVAERAISITEAPISAEDADDADASGANGANEAGLGVSRSPVGMVVAGLIGVLALVGV